MAVRHTIGTPLDPRLTPPTHALPWADEALCAQSDPELWFPDRNSQWRKNDDGDREVLARGICRRCPVKLPCLRYALDDSTLEGIWGGTTTHEREQMRALKAKQEESA